MSTRIYAAGWHSAFLILSRNEKRESWQPSPRAAQTWASRIRF